MDKETFKKRRRQLQQQSDELFTEIEANSKEERRFIQVLHDAPQRFQQLEQDFERRTSLNRVDIPFLMVATALQLLRIYLLSKFQERFQDENRLEHNDPSIKEMEKEEQEKYKQDHSDWESKKGSIIEWKSKKHYYRDWREIAFTTKVPYDSTRHSSKDFGRNMHGGQHRVKTLGHDPILGWLFGVCNIITDTITITPEYDLGEKKLWLPMVETYNVDMDSNFCWEEQTNTFNIFRGTIESTKEDKHRLYAAVFAQGLHLASDKWTKMGLPIPFLSLIAPDKAYEIYSKGYDYLDFEYDTQILRRTFKSAAYAMLINKLISALHLFFYNPNKETNYKLYCVRTRKIVLYSNLIATSSDIIQTAIRAYNGDESALKDFDLGGFIVTIYRLITDVAFIQNVKEEFIFNEWDKLLNIE